MRRSPLVVILLALLAGPVEAQLVRGQVVDSITMVPVPGARVVLLDAGQTPVASTIADREGRFLIRPAQAGEYRLRVAHDAYHESTFPAFTLGPEESTAFLLLLAGLDPPERTAADVITQLCPDAPPDRGVVTGFVLDAVTQAPVPDARLVASWPRLSDAMAQLVQRGDAGRLRDEVTTDRAGTYVICGVPPQTDVVIHAASLDLLSDFIEVRFDSGGVVVDGGFRSANVPLLRQDLELMAPGQHSAAVTGVVMDAGSMMPVEGVTVVIDAIGHQTVTDERGTFQLGALPQGRAWVTIRHLGFRPITREVQLRGDETVVFPPGAFLLETLPAELAPVVVEADARRTRRELAEFWERRERGGVGDFSTREEWQKNNPQFPTDVLRRMRGIRIVPCRGPNCPADGKLVLTTRGQSRTMPLAADAPSTCYPQYFLDKQYIGDSGHVSVDDILPMTELEAIEVYTSIAGLPQEFNRQGSTCGVIAFWTR